MTQTANAAQAMTAGMELLNIHPSASKPSLISSFWSLHVQLPVSLLFSSSRFSGPNPINRTCAFTPCRVSFSKTNMSPERTTVDDLLSIVGKSRQKFPREWKLVRGRLRQSRLQGAPRVGCLLRKGKTLTLSLPFFI